MFGFLFKRQGTGKPDGGREGAPAGGKTAPEHVSGEAQAPVSTREQQAQQLARLDGDERACADFILGCDFAELRLAAAEHIHSREHLERVHAAMRNVDRRVAKLMHARLDALRHHDAELRRGAEALAQARTLLSDELLTPNHVAALDRQWALISAPELAAEFDAVRARLGRRLEAQVQLQRAMIDRLAALRALELGELSNAGLAAEIERLGREHEQALADPEHASLPRVLVNEFAAELARLTAARALLEQQREAVAERTRALDAWEATPREQLTPEGVRRQWQALPALPAGEAEAHLRARFEQLLANLAQAARQTAAPAGDAAPAPAAREPRKLAPRADQDFLDQLDAFEAALQHGSLAVAADIDKALKERREQGVRLTPPQAERLSHLRAELKRLSDWARWGGNVSREELIRTVEGLPAQGLSMPELAKKVGSMRERWKALDALSGPAPRALWERFDAACGTAYAPAAAHFRQLAEERHANAERGEALLAEAQGEVARLEGEPADWKRLAVTVDKLRTAWSRLGPIDRKEKKRLDTEFSAALSVLQRPLAEQRRVEIAVREQLIEEVGKLDPRERHTVALLRELQSRWQERARALPLERKTEQALWLRFRAACDALFEARRESAHAADDERRHHEQAKVALCEQLEAAAGTASGSECARLLHEAPGQWRALGPVPRAHEARLEQRFEAAQQSLRERIASARKAAVRDYAAAVRARIALIDELESALGEQETSGEEPAWRARWAALPPLASSEAPLLDARFDTALEQLGRDGGSRQDYLARRDAAQPALLDALLREEVALGIDSDRAYAQARLRLQVAALQDSLKSGNHTHDVAAGLRQLLGLGARFDAATQARIEQLLLHEVEGAA